MRRHTTLVLGAALVLMASACGGESSESDDTTGSTAPATTLASDDSAGTTAPPTDTSEANTEQTETTAPEAPASGDQTATVTLETGEVFEFSALCWLETQESAGQEILFTVVSYDDPMNLDVTQFGKDSFGGAASISLYDSTSYDTVWEANSLYGTAVELELNGSTVTGTGDFYPEGDIAATAVAGELIANC